MRIQRRTNSIDEIKAFWAADELGPENVNSGFKTKNVACKVMESGALAWRMEGKS